MSGNRWVNCVIVLVCIANGKSTAMDEWETWPFSKLENEVSPSRWNPSKNADQVIKEYVDTSIQGTLLAQQSVPHKLNVPYGPKPSQQYDIYGTDLPSDAPIYVWIHGGYWQEGSKDISGLFAPSLYKKGIRNIVLGYTLTPSSKIKEIEGEVQMAIEKIVGEFPSASITVGGHSAGAQLAAMLLHSDDVREEISDKIKGFHFVSGIYDLRPLVPTYVNSPLKLTRSTADFSSPLRIRKINKNFLNKGENIHITVTVGKYDSSLFQSQAQEYYKVLRKTFPETNYWKSENDDHFTLVQNMAKEESPAGENFLQIADDIKQASSSAGKIGVISSLALVTLACSLLL